MRFISQRSVVIAVLAVGIALAPGADTASAGHLTCGQTITQNTVLDEDLLCESTDGLVIGAPKITLSLAGHTVMGTAGLAVDQRTVGIRNPGFDGVKIDGDGGTVEYFGTGIRLDGVDRGLIENVNVRGVLPPTFFFQSTVGILLVNSNANTVVGTTADTNGSVGTGISLAVSHRNILENNRTNGNEVGILVQASNGSRLLRNDASGNSDGIHLAADSIRSLLVGNVADFNGDDGIDVDSSHTTLTANTANFNSDWGIEAVLGVRDGGGNTATGNNGGGAGGQCLNVSC
jgi:parallel beta-helix repeat protein